MTQIEQIKAYTFDKTNAAAARAATNSNKSYYFNISDIRGRNANKAKEQITKDGYAEWSAVYVILNDHDEVQYIGNAIREPWHRINNHIKNKPEITDDWHALILYSKLWEYTHERIERELTDLFLGRGVALPLVKNR